MIIALTNDDGIQAPGLRAMYKALQQAGHTVHCVAPVTEQSAVGHAVTLSMPLRVKQFKENGFKGRGVYGTPVDCVKLGLTALLDEKPDIVVSGINSGANVGPDILYSGTVSAATEAAMLGYPALAVSYDSFKHGDLMEQAEYATRLLDRIPWNTLPHRCVMNLNFPHMPIAESKGLSVCSQTSAVWKDWYDHRKDPRGSDYWWLNGIIPPETVGKGTDRSMLSEGWITLTPLKFEFTDHAALEALAGINEAETK